MFSCRSVSIDEWFPTKQQINEGVDEKGIKIFEAFYGLSFRPFDFAWHRYQPGGLTTVVGASDDFIARSLADYAVNQYNKNKKQNQPTLQLVRVVGAIKISIHSLTFYLITFQALGPSNGQRKFFVKLSERYTCRYERIFELDEWMPVDNDLTQLNHPLYKLRKKKSKVFRQLATDIETKKQGLLNEMINELHHLVKSKEDEATIWKVWSAELNREMQFNKHDGLQYEVEDPFASLHAQDQLCESSKRRYSSSELLFENYSPKLDHDGCA